MRSVSRGFTLIEIMLVVVIIGCAVGIVVLSIPGLAPGGTVDLRTRTENLTVLMNQIAEQSLLEGRTIALRVDPEGYQFLVRQQKKSGESMPQDNSLIPTPWEDQVWAPYQNEKLAVKGTFPTGTQVELELGGLTLDDEARSLGMEKQDWFGCSEDADNREPQILFLPGGEITPFQLTLTAEAEDESSQQPPFLAQIRGDETGRVQWLDRAALEAEKK